MVTVGVLALQGDFAEHESMLNRLNVAVREVRLPHDLDGIDAMIIPGGESTTIARLMEAYGLVDPIRRFAREKPVWGTCAGMIVMAHGATDLDRETLDIMDIEVMRNAFGRQVDSFEADIDFVGLEEPLHAVFIRAPLILGIGEGVDVLARLDDGKVVAARQGKLLATAFHPELTDDLRLHRYFVALAEKGAPNSG